ncbi:MAG: hypothetical protein LW884_07965 [Bacteroidetes bacterium]|jgi:uncharacterized membrane protein|nr:hypothetical protein [Bacteroidota bacterium]
MMAKWISYLWLAVLVALSAYFFIAYSTLTQKTRLILSIAMFVAALLYGFRRSQYKRQQGSGPGRGEDA